MVLAAVLLGMAVNWMIGSEAEGPAMILMGALCIFFDVSYRMRTPTGHWIIPWGGGHVMFIPVWILGVCWFIVGAVKLKTNPAPIGMFGGLFIGILIVVALGLTIVQIILRAT